MLINAIVDQKKRTPLIYYFYMCTENDIYIQCNNLEMDRSNEKVPNFATKYVKQVVDVILPNVSARLERYISRRPIQNLYKI